MTTKTNMTEKAITFIAKNGVARTEAIAKAAGFAASVVSARLHPYVQGGVLVSCRVEQPGKASGNEYRLATGVTLDNWRSFKIFAKPIEKEALKDQRKQVLPPAHTPADRPEVSETNTGSTSAENSSLAATGRAVTVAKPHRKASQPAPGAGGHVTAKAAQNIPKNIPDPVIPKFGYFSDGSVRIVKGGSAIELDQADADRLVTFILSCTE